MTVKLQKKKTYRKTVPFGRPLLEPEGKTKET